MSSAKDYYDLYMASKEKVRQEELIQNSLKYSIIRELRNSGAQFLADISGFYWREDTKNSWKKAFFDKMNEHFFGEIEWEFKDIASVGVERYGYRMGFKIDDKKYAIFLPNPKEITAENIVRAEFGQYELSKNTNGAVWTVICSSYDMKDIAAAIKKESEV